MGATEDFLAEMQRRRAMQMQKIQQAMQVLSPDRVCWVQEPLQRSEARLLPEPLAASGVSSLSWLFSNASHLPR
jgi:hypothetical protein